MTAITKRLKIQGFSAKGMAGDLSAAVTKSIDSVTGGMGNAVLAGVNPVYGLYTVLATTAGGMLLFTFALTLVLPVQYAVLLGVLLAMGYYIYQSSTDIGLAELVMQPDGTFIEREEPDRLLPNPIVLLEPFGSLYFAGASSLENMKDESWRP